MSRLRIFLTSVLAGLVVASAAVLVPLFAQGPSSAAIDEAAIKDIVRKYVDAREARDAKAIEPLLTADADQLVSDGTWRKGRDALVRGMLESSKRTGGRRSIAVESVRLLSPDMALADGRYTQTGLAEGKERVMWTTIVLKRGSDGWRIAAIRNMLPAAPATKSKPSKEKHDQPTVRYEVEEGPPKDKAAEKRRDYAVLEAALDDLANPKNPEYKHGIQVFRERREIVIDEHTWEGNIFVAVDESVNSDQEAPRRIPDDIRADLRRRNAGPVRSLADFKPANPNIVVRDLDKLFERPGGLFGANVEFEKRFPNACCYVGVHLPGYSTEGDSAIIVFQGGPRGDHNVNWVYMLSRKGKRWEVQWRHLHIHE